MRSDGSLPVFGNIITLALFQADGKVPNRRIALKILVSQRMLRRGSSRSIRPVILSAPGAFLILSLSITAATAFGEKEKDLGGRHFISGGGGSSDCDEWGVKTCCRWLA